MCAWVCFFVANVNMLLYFHKSSNHPVFLLKEPTRLININVTLTIKFKYMHHCCSTTSRKITGVGERDIFHTNKNFFSPIKLKS